MDSYLAKDYRQDCRYGANCYQKNPEHKAKFKHPSDNEVKKTVNDEKNNVEEVSDKENKENVDDSSKKRQLSDTEDVSDSKKHKLHSFSSSEESQEEDDTTDTTDNKEESKEPVGEEEKFDDILENSPEGVKENIKQKYLMSMPEDFYIFYDFCKSLSASAPLEALAAADLKLCGPYDILADNIPATAPQSQSLYLTHGRYYYDPPEMTTVICETTYKTGLHIGYMRDSPQESPVFLVSNVETEGSKLTILGDNIFAAVYHHLAAKLDTVDPFRRSKISGLSEKIKLWVNRASMEGNSHSLNLEKKSSSMKNRDRLKVATTFHGAGIVVPYNKQTEVSY